MTMLSVRRYQTYQYSLPQSPLGEWRGRLFALEGIRGCGCTTQARLLKETLEKEGFSACVVCPGDSALFAPELLQAQTSNVLSPRAILLLQAAAFYDQLEKLIIPALHAGQIVLADRYLHIFILSMMGTGLRKDWLQEVFAAALIPDAVFYLSLAPEETAVRLLRERQELARCGGLADGNRHDHYAAFLANQFALSAAWAQNPFEADLISIRAEQNPEQVHTQILTHIFNRIKK
ncbi:MAG: hypothetical protein RBU29_17885 [bacterium]|jgi:thymidylate kinase|nr:hypothetical protein [bacterium]